MGKISGWLVQAERRCRYLSCRWVNRPRACGERRKGGIPCSMNGAYGPPSTAQGSKSNEREGGVIVG